MGLREVRKPDKYLMVEKIDKSIWSKHNDTAFIFLTEVPENKPSTISV